MDCISSISDVVACPKCYKTSSPIPFKFRNRNDEVFQKMICNDANCSLSFIWCTVCSSSLSRPCQKSMHEKSKKHEVNLGKVVKPKFDEIIFDDEPSHNLPGAIHVDTAENDEISFDNMERCEPLTDHQRCQYTSTKSIKQLLIEQKTNKDAPATSMYTFFMMKWCNHSSV